MPESKRVPERTYVQISVLACNSISNSRIPAIRILRHLQPLREALSEVVLHLDIIRKCNGEEATERSISVERGIAQETYYFSNDLTALLKKLSLSLSSTAVVREYRTRFRKISSLKLTTWSPSDTKSCFRLLVCENGTYRRQ